MRLPRLIRWICLAALAAGLAGLFLAALPGPLHRAELLGLGAAFSTLSIGFFAAAIGAALGLIGLGLGLWKRLGRGPLLAAGAGGAAGLAVLITVLNLIAQAQAHPLHDVTTDLDMPPRFATLEPRRYPDDMSETGETVRAAAFPHPDWRSTHADLYPNLNSQRYGIGPEQALARAEQVAKRMGLDIVAAERTKTGARLEAVATTGWFGFQDDVVVRITDLPNGVAVDMRSVSRVGRSDLGANARRVRRFLQLYEAAG